MHIGRVNWSLTERYKYLLNLLTHLFIHEYIYSFIYLIDALGRTEVYFTDTIVASIMVRKKTDRARGKPMTMGRLLPTSSPESLINHIGQIY